MGRYYYGNIKGKFWFAVQNSNAMLKFGAKELGKFYYFNGCGCSVGNGHIFQNDEPSDVAYCKECYNSYDEHKKDIIDYYDELWYEDNVWEWEMDRFEFEDEGMKYINTHKDLVNSIIEIVVNEDDDFDYDIEFKKDANGNELEIPRHQEEVFADYCMLKQIEKYFEKNTDVGAVCSWSAEY